uniref:Colony stimulating factor 3 (Granulocyte) a n=1 Tax=Nothobranchius kuhntae TaxID=321403 RepID=A0A1A8IUS6_NOTKU
MAFTAHSAPLPESGSPVEDPQFQDGLYRSRSLTQKILLSVPDTHKSCIHTETLQLNSAENSKLATIASTIGVPPAPVLGPLSGNVSLEDSLRRMYEGLKLHQELLNLIAPRLEEKEKVTDLMDDIRDLTIQIKKMLKTGTKQQPTIAPVALRLPGSYEVQVAAHLTLVQLQSFGQDMDRVFRSLDQSS